MDHLHPSRMRGENTEPRTSSHSAKPADLSVRVSLELNKNSGINKSTNPSLHFSIVTRDHGLGPDVALSLAQSQHSDDA